MVEKLARKAETMNEAVRVAAEDVVSKGIAPRHRTVAVDVGGVMVGGGAPIVVQSMTNTDTADVEATARQVAALARAGSELVRITVDRDAAAAAVPRIRDRLGEIGGGGPLRRQLPHTSPKIIPHRPG